MRLVLPALLVLGACAAPPLAPPVPRAAEPLTLAQADAVARSAAVAPADAARAYGRVLAAADSALSPADSAAVRRHLARLVPVAPGLGLEAEPRTWAPGTGAAALRWWRGQDPLPATPANERVAEHIAPRRPRRGRLPGPAPRLRARRARAARAPPRSARLGPPAEEPRAPDVDVAPGRGAPAVRGLGLPVRPAGRRVPVRPRRRRVPRGDGPRAPPPLAPERADDRQTRDGAGHPGHARADRPAPPARVCRARVRGGVGRRPRLPRLLRWGRP